MTPTENILYHAVPCTVSYELFRRAMKLKLLAACSLLFGWCLATGLISAKVQVENGPARLVGHQFVSNVFFTTTFFGQRLVKVGMPSQQVTTALQSGKPIDPAMDKFIKATMLLLSLCFLIMSFRCVMLASSRFAPHRFDSEPAQGETTGARDLELGMLGSGDAGDDSPGSVGLTGSGDCRICTAPPWLQPCHSRPAWMQTRQVNRFMARPVPWNESFDNAFLGTVVETDVLASGFGGVVRAGSISEHHIVSKELHRDDDDEELFKEVYVGLLVPASPCMGFAVTEGGAPRLISARLPENVAEFLARSDWRFETCLQLAIGMLESVEHLAHLGLVHCDIKPNNFMLDDQRHVFIIDFGSVSVEGDVPPMTCQQYCPPDSVVTLAWDVFSLGVVFSEMLRLDRVTPHIAQQNPGSHGGRSMLERLVSRMCSHLMSDRPSLRECSFVLRAAFEASCV